MTARPPLSLPNNRARFARQRLPERHKNPRGSAQQRILVRPAEPPPSATSTSITASPKSAIKSSVLSKKSLPTIASPIRSSSRTNSRTTFLASPAPATPFLKNGTAPRKLSGSVRHRRFRKPRLKRGHAPPRCSPSTASRVPHHSPQAIPSPPSPARPAQQTGSAPPRSATPAPRHRGFAKNLPQPSLAGLCVA